MNLGDLVRSGAAQNPNVTALFYRDRTMSYAELDASSDALAGWFVRHGLKPGDRVALQWPNEIEAVELYFGVFKAGLIAVPVNLRLKPTEIAWVLSNSGAALCFSHPALAAGVMESGIKVYTEVPRSEPGATAVLPNVEEDDPSSIIYTSGSTGRPKGAVHTHRSLLAAAQINIHAIAAQFGGQGGTERGLIMTPMMHVSGLYSLFCTMWLNQSSVLLPVFEPGAVLDAIEKFGCTVTLTLPALMQFVLEEQLRKPRNVSSLKVIFGGGDSVPVALQNRVREILGVELLEGLAQTETGPVMTNPILAPRPGSVGKVMHSVEVRVVDFDFKDVEAGQVGDLLVRSPGVCRGYWNNPEATADSIRDGWFNTGDLVSRDADGYYWFRGRRKEIIIRGGSNISPQEVEEALYTHPEILEAGVVGMPHEVWGELVVAFVALRDPATANEDSIREHARKHLADYKVPEKVHVLPVLPKGPTGKVHRKALKDKLIAETNAERGNT
jgi:long-chain acyl-CoA synthetase